MRVADLADRQADLKRRGPRPLETRPVWRPGTGHSLACVCGNCPTCRYRVWWAWRLALRAAGLPRYRQLGLCECGRCERCRQRREMRRWRLWREIGLRYRELVYGRWRRGEGLAWGARSVGE